MSYDTTVEITHNGCEQWLVHVPGWALDGRIFSPVTRTYNVITFHRVNPFTFSDELMRIMKEQSIAQVMMMGFSMGAFLALDFHRAFPDKVNALVLIGLSTGYPAEGIADIRRYLSENPTGYIRSFYQACFSDKSAFKTFLRDLGSDTIRHQNLPHLLDGLDYLETVSLHASQLDTLPVRAYYHGREDRIAEWESLATQLPSSWPVTLWPQSGHLESLYDALSESSQYLTHGS